MALECLDLECLSRRCECSWLFERNLCYGLNASKGFRLVFPAFEARNAVEAFNLTCGILEVGIQLIVYIGIQLIVYIGIQLIQSKEFKSSKLDNELKVIQRKSLVYNRIGSLGFREIMKSLGSILILVDSLL